MSYLLNLIRGAAIEFSYLDIETTEMKKTTQNEYKNIPNKEKIIAFNFFNTTFDFEFDINLFPNVESLYFESIMFNSLSSYSFISKCSKLHKLYFKNCNIKYLSSLINTSNIELKSLTLDSIDIIDDVDISLITTLEELYIIKSRLTRIGDLFKLQNLKILNLNNNSLVKLNQIEKLTKLKILNISFNALVNIDEIENLSLLEEININNNQITQLWNLEKTPLIKKLFLSKNNITNVNDLIKLKNLEVFEINLNPINSLPNLLLLQHLNYDLIKVDWNQIINVEGMKGFGLIKNIIKNLTLNI
jgi:Leucine-rich repeat (LRR) protein